MRQRAGLVLQLDSGFQLVHEGGGGGVHSLHEHQQRVNVYMGVGCCCDGCGGLH